MHGLRTFACRMLWLIALSTILLFLREPATLAAVHEPVQKRDPDRELIIRFKPQTDILQKRRALKRSTVTKDLKPHVLHRQNQARPKGETHLLQVPEGVDPGQELARLRANPAVAFAEPNYRITISQDAAAEVVPNDFYFSSLYGLRNTGQEGGRTNAHIHAAEAWSHHVGSAATLVAVIDTGIDYLHEDLAPNMWVNNAEIEGNGIDDDGNGYVDDIFGYDFVSHDSDPIDDMEHGTHVAGTIGARGNNGIGVSGVCWEVSLMALKAFDEDGNGSVADAIEAIMYAIDNGARIINASWGLSEKSLALEETVNYAAERGVLIIAASGNQKSEGSNYPAGFDQVLSVGATDNRDARAGFSNWGADVDLAGPGVNILSTLPENSYGASSGTSMATPHVVGVAALVLSRFPHYSRDDLWDILINSTDPIIVDNPIGRGRINAHKAILTDFPLAKARLLVPQTLSGHVDLFGTAAGSAAIGYSVEAGTGNYPPEWIEVISSSGRVTNGILTTFNTAQLPDGAAIIRLTVTNSNGQVASDIASVNIFNSRVSFPASGDILRAGDTYEVRGTVFGEGKHYRLFYGNGLIPTSWQLIAEGESSQDLDRPLGTWKTQLTNSFYTLRLLVTDQHETNEFTAPGIYLDSQLRPGWPETLPTESDFSPSDWRTIRVADLDGDGQFEVVIVDSGSLLRASSLLTYNSSGELLWTQDLGKGVEPDIPAIGDINGDGKLEIFVDGKMQIHAFDHLGFPLATPWPVSVRAGNLSKSLADLDGDGRLELVSVSLDPIEESGGEMTEINVFSSQGDLIRRWSIPWCASTNETQKIFPAVGNLDNDDELEIVVVTGCSELSCFKISEAEPVWKKSINGALLTSPVIGDLEGDGKPEIVIGAAREIGHLEGGIYVFSGNGELRPGWPVLEDQSFLSPIALGDLNRDGRLEIAAPSWNTFKMHLIEADGFEADGWPISLGNGAHRVSPAIAPADASGTPRLILGAPGYPSLVFRYGNTNYIGGVQGWGFSGGKVPLGVGRALTLPMEAVTTARFHKNGGCAVADLDGDGMLELLTASIQDRTYGSYAAFKNRSSLYAWDLGVPVPKDGMDWPMPWNNLQNTGAYSLPPKPYNPGPTNVTLAIRDRFLVQEDRGAVLNVITNDINAGPGKLEIVLFTNPAFGRLVHESWGSFYYEPNTNFSGLDTFAYTVRDGLGAESEATVKLMVKSRNDPPIAVPKMVEVKKNASLDIFYEGIDPEGQKLTFKVTSSPTHGELWNYPNLGNYHPYKGYFGTDSFSYTVSDGLHESAPALVSITVINSNNPPKASNLSLVTKPNRPTLVNLKAKDPDGDPIEFVIVSPPENGDVLPNGAAFTYTPRTNFTGNDSFIVRAFDGQEFSEDAFCNITVTITNSAPFAIMGSHIVPPNEPFELELAGLDPDGDSLTYTIVDAPTHGTLEGTPPDLLYTPDLDYLGPDRLTFIVSDGQEMSAPAEISLHVARVNRPPEVGDMIVSTRTNTTVSVKLKTTDLDGDELRGVILKGPRHGQVFGKGTQFTYSPDSSFSGLDTFTYKVWDGQKYGGPATVSVYVITFSSAKEPCFNSLVIQSTGGLSADLTVPPFQPFTIETSTNLIEWTNYLGPVTSGTGSFQFNDPDTAGVKFYRVIINP